MMTVSLWLSVIVLDFLIGDPHSWPHPIIFIGKLIKALEKGLRQIGMDSRLGGVILWIGTTGLVLTVLSLILGGATRIHPWLNTALTVYFLFASLAATSLKTEVMKVLKGLMAKDLDEGRKQLSWLVGRDTASLSEEEVVKGAVETVAENTIDGVLAPMLYILVGFLIGYPVQLVFLYKAVNTMDSMVGYIQEPYTRIGWCSAKMDDLFNLLPARIGSCLMVLAGGLMGYDFRKGWKIWRRDCRNHKSPNAGYPEAAVAGLLHIQLGGTHRYFGQVLKKPTIGDANRPVEAEDIQRTVNIMYLSEVILMIIGVLILIYVNPWW